MKVSEFNVGDLVRIGEVRGSRFSTSGMYFYTGRVGKIAQGNIQRAYKIEGCEWWFAGEILTLIAAENQQYIQGFLAGQEVEVQLTSGIWSKIDALTRENAKRPMRFAKTEEVLAIEKEINVLKENVVELEKQKNDIISIIKSQKSRISRREKKLKTLS